ncbi:MAG: aminodeoxychorismate lyase [Steroidobacteraceae bacterium]
MPVLVNGRAGGQLDPMDRGLQYGDGLFETLAVRNGRARFMAAHLARLAEGARRLALPLPDPDRLTGQIAAAWPKGRGVVKLILTRGPAGRGYRPPVVAEPTLIVAGFEWPNWPAAAWTEGIRLRYCRTRLGQNPALAGIKHLNRLEQVLARAEWDDDRIAEGLMLDSMGQVISGTQTNIFAVIAGRAVTPTLDQCGVAGVMRNALCGWAAAEGGKVVECSLRPEELETATGIFVTNALIGAWPVRELEGRQLQAGTLAARFNAWLALQ